MFWEWGLVCLGKEGRAPFFHLFTQHSTPVFTHSPLPALPRCKSVTAAGLTALALAPGLREVVVQRCPNISCEECCLLLELFSRPDFDIVHVTE